MSDKGSPTAPLGDHETAINHAIDRLAKRFPDVPRERIVTLVHQRHATYNSASIRDFIPVLIEHDLKRTLATELTPEA